MSEREKIHDSQGMYAERPIIPRATSSMEMGIANGTIGSSSTQPHSVLLHESCDCNHRCLTQARQARLAGKARQVGTGLTRHASPALRACRAPLRHFATNSRE
jgi:hypothetical protein